MEQNVNRTQRTANYDVRDTLTWVEGKHTLRVGFESRREQYNQTTFPVRLMAQSPSTEGIAKAVYGPSPLGAPGNLLSAIF